MDDREKEVEVKLGGGCWVLEAGWWRLGVGSGSWVVESYGWELGFGCWKLGGGSWEAQWSRRGGVGNFGSDFFVTVSGFPRPSHMLLDGN